MKKGQRKQDILKPARGGASAGPEGAQEDRPQQLVKRGSTGSFYTVRLRSKGQN